MKRDAPPGLADITDEVRTPNFTHDPHRRITRVRMLGRIGGDALGGESVILRSQGPVYCNADVYLRTGSTGLATFNGSRWRAYARVDAQRSLEYVQDLSSVPAANSSQRVLGIRGRGGLDALEISLQVDPASVLPTDNIEMTLVTWEGAATAGASPSPSPVGGTRLYYTIPAFTTSGVISTQANRILYRFWGTLDPGAAAPRYIQVFNKAAAPAPGDTPIHRFYVGPGASFSLWVDGEPFGTGISWGVSTTRDTFTASADVADVDAEFT